MNESIKALCDLEPQLQKQYDKNYNIRPLADTLQTILAAIEALKPTIENYDIVDGKFVLCPTCGALPCDWGNDLNYRAAIKKVKP